MNNLLKIWILIIHYIVFRRTNLIILYQCSISISAQNEHVSGLSSLTVRHSWLVPRDNTGELERTTTWTMQYPAWSAWYRVTLQPLLGHVLVHGFILVRYSGRGPNGGFHGGGHGNVPHDPIGETRENTSRMFLLEIHSEMTILSSCDPTECNRENTTR